MGAGANAPALINRKVFFGGRLEQPPPPGKRTGQHFGQIGKRGGHGARAGGSDPGHDNAGPNNPPGKGSGAAVKSSPTIVANIGLLKMARYLVCPLSTARWLICPTQPGLGELGANHQHSVRDTRLENRRSSFFEKALPPNGFVPQPENGPGPTQVQAGAEGLRTDRRAGPVQFAFLGSGGWPRNTGRSSG